jgi:soluble cytochrome b562
MKIRLIVSGLLLAPILVSQAVRAQPPGPPPGNWSEPKTPLEKDMHQIASAVKKLKKQLGDASQNASSLELVAQIRDGASAASGETPSYAADKPEAERAAFVADFQSDMKDFVAKVDTLAATLKANDNDAAAKIFKELIDAEHKGHKEFQKPKPQQ